MTLLEPILHYLTTCGLKVITLQDVTDGSGRDRRQVLRVLDKLAGEGYLAEIEDNREHLKAGESGPPRRNPTWKILQDLDARPKPNPPRKNTNRDKIWRLIRAKHRFTKPELVVASGAKPNMVDQYVRLLERNGYVRRTGKDGSLVTYMLVKVNQVKRPRGMDKGGAA